MTALLDGDLTVVHDASGISDRVRDGDPLIGWEGGDYTLYYRRGADEPFEVWSWNAKHEPYCALTADYCDHRILRRLRDAHWKTLVDRHTAQRAEMLRQRDEATAERRDFDYENMPRVMAPLRDHIYQWGYGGGDRRRAAG